LVKIPAGSVVLGKDKSSPRYGWDNEYGRHEADVAAFQASRLLVSNQEFLAFVEAGGYSHPGYWEDEGKEWLDFTHAEHPSFWVPASNGWRLRLMTEEI
ncbi:SUMF1/EgtB/PvdO family nonheme iron enzyme, partial [Thermolongibacillus altinsuensis]|uniref:SUMF1/EgtB/PvdO family nonheme iron enzyme n=1 Tax=Thermolongibacillus altinsuensis TaxID=575256 RepID=UPI002555A573